MCDCCLFFIYFFVTISISRQVEEKLCLSTFCVHHWTVNISWTIINFESVTPTVLIFFTVRLLFLAVMPPSVRLKAPIRLFDPRVRHSILPSCLMVTKTQDLVLVDPRGMTSQCLSTQEKALLPILKLFQHRSISKSFNPVEDPVLIRLCLKNRTLCHSDAYVMVFLHNFLHTITYMHKTRQSLRKKKEMEPEIICVASRNTSAPFSMFENISLR